MRSLSHGHVKSAIATVRASKWRSMLTMLGIIIGIVSVVTIVSIGEGVKHQVSDQVNSVGKDVLTIRPGQLVHRTQNGTISSVNIFSPYAGTGALTDHDVNVIKRTKGVGEVVPLSVVTGDVTHDGQTYPNGVVIGTSPDLPTLLNHKLDNGGFFSDDDENENGAIIGASVARDLFSVDVPLGQSFDFHGQTFIVRGIFAPFKNAPLSVDTDFNNAIFIPHKVAQDLTNNKASIYQVLVRPQDPHKLETVRTSIDQSLKASHGGQEDFTILRPGETLGVTNNILSLLTALIGGVAAISLLVGGIGIMNVMLVSVTERMHEIGIRKAIGATNRQILNQFLIESTVLSVFGGVIGIVISILITLFLRAFSSLQPVIVWPVVGLAVFVSMAVGILFGTAPALKAARKDPIDALRNE